MAVDPAARGHGYADLLMRAALDAARARDAREVVLRTNTVLAAAVRLYEKHGFTPTRTGPGIGAEFGYTRGNLEMVLPLTPPAVHDAAVGGAEPTLPTSYLGDEGRRASSSPIGATGDVDRGATGVGWHAAVTRQ